MPEYLSPGVYVEEIDVGTKPIEGVATSNLGIVGPTERGPTEVRLITSWLEYQRVYGVTGGQAASSHMAHAVKGYFDNGGARAFVARVVSRDPSAQSASIALDTLTLTALGPGLTGNQILVSVKAPNTSVPDPNRFQLVIASYGSVPNPPFLDPTNPNDIITPGFVRPELLEVYDDLSFDPADQRYVLLVLRGSNLVWGLWNGAPGRPADAPLAPMTNGADGIALTSADYDGDEFTLVRNGIPVTYSTGLLGLERIDEVTLLTAPDQNRFFPAVREKLLVQCERLKDRFAIISQNQERNPTNVINDRPSLYGASYWPWIYVSHPNGRERVLVPPVGHVAGIYAKADIERGVHKAPANYVVAGALDLEFPVNKGMQDLLNPRGVNVIRDFRADRRGIRVWGARTISNDPSWKYINVRRLFIFLEESIDEGTQWVVFEPNSEALWDRVRRSIESFLITVWRNGALMGVRTEEAFYVKCDRTTMTQDDIDNGRLICYIGVAPVKPAEFVIFRMHQWTLGSKPPV
jgi:phage tail sheath protein FI